MKFKKSIIVIFLSTISLTVTANCDLDSGKDIFNKCAACHKAEKNQGHFVGPNLNSVIGRTVGSVDGFKFSRQMRDDSRIWDKKLFMEFIESPAEIFPRTRMGFAGIKDQSERESLFCYLEKLKEKTNEKTN